MSELRICVKVEVDVLGVPSLNSPYGLCGRKATFEEEEEECIPSESKSCVKVEVAVLSSPSQIVLMVSVDVKKVTTESRISPNRLQPSFLGGLVLKSSNPQ